MKKCYHCNNLVKKKFCNHKCLQSYYEKIHIQEWLEGIRKGGTSSRVASYVRSYL